jgi:transposase
VTVSDWLKQRVLQCHLYDPDLNPDYAQLAIRYSTSVVSARPGHPKDKAIAEGLVKISVRYAPFRYRGARFTSLTQINEALGECVERIRSVLYMTVTTWSENVALARSSETYLRY